MRIAVCEDNEIHRDILEHLLTHYFSERSIPFELVPYKYGMNFLYDMEEGAYFDIAFLDIYMDDTMGNQIAHKLRAMGYQGEIVFFTASPNFAIESYDVDASGYLLKPLDTKDMTAVLMKTVPDRIHTVIPGLIIAEVLAERFHSKEITYSDSGVREGYIYSEVLK